MPPFTFNREERLKSRKIIALLFKDGYSFSAYPLRIVWKNITLPATSVPVQFGVTVPKRSFSKAVQRNRIKRLIREAYRLNKNTLYEKLSNLEESDQPDLRQYGIMVIYIAKEPLPYQDIERATKKWISILVKKIRQEELS